MATDQIVDSKSAGAAIPSEGAVHQSRSAADAEFYATVSAIVGAFGDPTRRDIYLFAREGSGVTATEVASEFDLHPNVARHHLDRLSAGGYLDVYVDRTSLLGAGRPSKKYRGSSKAAGFETPHRQFELTSMLLSRALEMLPLPEAEAMAESVGEEYGKTIASQMQPAETQRSLSYALRAIADALTAHGFASKQDENQRLRLINHACPFGVTALEHPVLCAVDRGIVKGMLSSLYRDSVPLTMSSRAKGDQDCAVVYSTSSNCP